MVDQAWYEIGAARAARLPFRGDPSGDLGEKRRSQSGNGKPVWEYPVFKDSPSLMHCTQPNPNESPKVQVGLTRFRGHLNSREKGVHDVKDKAANYRIARASGISSSPQSTQYLCRFRRCPACFCSSHSMAGISLFTTSPHIEQERTGTFRCR